MATDGSPDADQAAKAAVDLEGRCGARLHVAHAWANLPATAYLALTLDNYSHLYEREAKELLKDQVLRINDLGGDVAFAHLREGRPAEVVADLADELGADLVVVGSCGLGRARRIVTGSASEGVVRLASCPVLVVRGEDGAWPSREVIIGETTPPTKRFGPESWPRGSRVRSVCRPGSCGATRRCRWATGPATRARAGSTRS